MKIKFQEGREKEGGGRRWRKLFKEKKGHRENSFEGQRMSEGDVAGLIFLLELDVLLPWQRSAGNPYGLHVAILFFFFCF